MADADKKTMIAVAGREVTPAFTLHKISTEALSKAEKTKEGSFLEIITALLMCPLTMEAVLNYVGQKLFAEEGKLSLWERIDRLSPREKLESIADLANVKINFGVPPFQDFGEMFKFRNRLVHPKPFENTVRNVEAGLLHHNTPDLDKIPNLQAGWEKYCNLETAIRWHQSVKDMAERLCCIASCINPILTGYSSHWEYQAYLGSA